MILEVLTKLNTLIHSALDDIAGLKKPRRDFFIEIMLLFLSIPGRMNFLQFERYGKYGEQRYRQQFEKQFDFLNFNIQTTMAHGSGHLVLAFDPSYISKSGTKTYGLDKFWSGVAGKAKIGLEISGIAAIDIDNHTAFHLEAVQTPTHQELKAKNRTLLDLYADIIVSRKEKLGLISKCIVADAYFSKKSFADSMIDSAGLHLISRLRKDADLMYLYNGDPTGKRGRPRVYDGKINTKDIDTEKFQFIEENERASIYTAVVYGKALKRKIRLVYAKLKKNNSHLMYFSTDTALDALVILDYYKKRFQIEFLYRDGKQHTGLNDCQARSENKLHFHFNASLTAINLAKVEHWLSVPKEKRGAFSMTDVKIVYHNALMLKRFIRLFAVPAYKLINTKSIKELINFGRIAT